MKSPDLPHHLPTEADLRFLWDHAGLLLCITDEHRRLFAVNRGWTDVLGWREDELLGRDYLEFIHPDDRERSLNAEVSYSALGEPQILDFENRYVHADGSIRWLQWSAFQRGDQWLALGRDATAMHTSQAALRRSERRSRAMLAAMHEGLIVLGPDRRILEVSERMGEMVGWRPSELIGRRPPFPWWPPEEADRIHAMLRKALQGDYGSQEFVFMRRDGERFPVLVENARLEAGDGTAPSVLAFIRDISELVDARRRLQEAHTVAGLISWEWHRDRDRVVTAFNGLDPRVPPDAEMTREESLQYVAPDGRDAMNQALREMAAGERDTFVVESVVEIPGLAPRRIQMRGRPMTDRDGKIVGVRGTTQDVTPRNAAV